MKYKLKLKHMQSGRETEEWVHSDNVQLLPEQYKKIGFQVLGVLEKQETEMPTIPVQPPTQAETIKNAVESVKEEIPQVKPQTVIPKQYLFFRDSGAEFRVDLSNQQIQKKGWRDLTSEERNELGISEKNKIVLLTEAKINVVKSDWLNVEKQ